MVIVSVGRAPHAPKRRGRWVVRFQGDTIRKHETQAMPYHEAERMALDWAAWYEDNGAKVSLSLPTKVERHD